MEILRVHLVAVAGASAAPARARISGSRADSCPPPLPGRHLARRRSILARRRGPAEAEPDADQDDVGEVEGGGWEPLGALSRLAKAGVTVDDAPARTPEGRKRKPPGRPGGEGLRDGPDLPLRNLAHEQTARHVAAGMDELTAWVHSGYSPHTKTWLEVTRHQDFIDRVVELRRADLEAMPVTLGYLQRRLLSIASADPANYFEHIPHSERVRAKDILSLSPELRSAISEVVIDKNGKVQIKLHDRVQALNALAKLSAPQRLEVSGPGGGPLQVDALVQNLDNLDDADLADLERLASKAAGEPPAEPPAEPAATAAATAAETNFGLLKVKGLDGGFGAAVGLAAGMAAGSAAEGDGDE